MYYNRRNFFLRSYILFHFILSLFLPLYVYCTAPLSEADYYALQVLWAVGRSFNMLT